LETSHEELYWKHVRVQVGGWTWNDRIVIEELITYGRAGAAVMCIAYAMDDDINFDPALATHALMAFLENPQEIQSLERYHVIDLIKLLQSSRSVDMDALYQIEWNFLPWFDPLSGESPVDLGKKLASDPKSFAEMIKLAFRSKNDLDDSVEKQDEKKKNIVERAYTLLHKIGSIVREFKRMARSTRRFSIIGSRRHGESRKKRDMRSSHRLSLVMF